MNLQKVQKLLSSPRFERYLIASGGNHRRALQLYKVNLKLAESIHPVLGTFEVVLRNQLDAELFVHFKNADWTIKNRKFLPVFMQQELAKSENRIRKKGGLVSHAKLVSDMIFGFWTEQFEKANFKILSGVPIQVFRFLPKTIRREEISKRLNQIRILRNRINHNEPICFKSAVVDFRETQLAYHHLCELLDWIDPDARLLLKGVDGVEKLLNRILRKYP